MRIGTACSIFLNIDSQNFTAEEKGCAIQMVADMPTHNGITKDSMLRVIRWLWQWVFSDMSPLETVHDAINVMPDVELARFLADIANGCCCPDPERECARDANGASACVDCYKAWLRRPLTAEGGMKTIH